MPTTPDPTAGSSAAGSSAAGSSAAGSSATGSSVAAGAQADRTIAAKMMTANSGYNFLNIFVLLHREIGFWKLGNWNFLL
jgi:hypothetical protein